MWRPKYLHAGTDLVLETLYEIRPRVLFTSSIGPFRDPRISKE
jgi:hypothetical protein